MYGVAHGIKKSAEVWVTSFFCLFHFLTTSVTFISMNNNYSRNLIVEIAVSYKNARCFF